MMHSLCGRKRARMEDNPRKFASEHTHTHATSKDHLVHNCLAICLDVDRVTI